MAASDVVLLASGTATLEATLVKRPMVVAYRLGALTSFLLKTLKLFKAPFFAQPNLLAGRQVVPEYLQRRGARRRARARACWRNWSVPIAISSCKLSPPSTRRCAVTRARVRRKPFVELMQASTSPVDGRAMSSAQLAFNLVRDGLRAGVDEAGRGPLAGPVVAAAVILDPRRRIRGIRDSKVIEPEERAELAIKIRERGDRVVGRLGRRRGNRYAEHPAGDLPGDAPRAARTARASRARADRRRPLSRRSSGCRWSAASRRSSTATRGASASAPPRSSRR